MEENKLSFKEKVQKIQTALKVKKGQHNEFGKYYYRSCEDILEKLKPLLETYKVFINFNEKLELVGDRYYIFSTATLQDNNSEDKVSTTTFAREEQERKGMTESQITGATISYARKYALNGLFAIDDREVDPDNNQENQEKQKKDEEFIKSLGLTEEEVKTIKISYKVDYLTDLTQAQQEKVKQIKFNKVNGVKQ